jgi:hypothetical protein
MYPTDRQMKALKKLENALKECKDANVYFHNCYGTLHAFDGEYVKSVDDTEDVESIYEPDSSFYPICLPCGEWADDQHYVHLKKKE